MKVKRILIYSTAYYPFVGGAEVAIKEITDRLPEYEFDLITALMDKKLPRQEMIGRVNVYRLGIGQPKFDKLYLAAGGHCQGLKLHRQNPYDMVWAMMASFGGFAALSFCARGASVPARLVSPACHEGISGRQREAGRFGGKLRSKIPYLLTLQEGDPTSEILKKVRLVRGRFNKIFTQANGLQSISNYLHRWGYAMGFKGQVAEVVPNGVDVGLFTKDYLSEEIKQLRQSFGFPDNAVIITTVSRLVIKNGIADVIKALKELPDNYCFYICGLGELENNLKQLTHDLGLEKRVVFAGYKGHQELPKILKASDIFIRPSVSEGLGNSFLEAMASGLPTIGTLVGGITDFLQDGITGIVCQPQNPTSIAQAISRAAKLSVEEKSVLHQNAMKIIKEKYNWDYIAGRMNYIFSALLIK